MCTNNISVSDGNWDAHALNIMSSAGAGNGTVSTTNPWKGGDLTDGRTATASSYYQNHSAFSPAQAIDGLHYTRWASNSTSGGWLEVDFGTPTTFNTTRMNEYVNEGSQIKQYQIQYWDGLAWVNVYSGENPHVYQTDLFEPVTATKVRLNISMTNGGIPSLWSFEVYNNAGIAQGSYKLMNRPQYLLVTPYAHSASPANLIQWNDDKSNDQYWRFVPTSDGYYKIVNKASGLLITPSGHSATSVQLIQWADDGNMDQQWQLIPTGDGYYKIKNKVSGLVITPLNHVTGTANLIQATDVDGFDQQWGLDLTQ